ncbi:MAG: TIGR02677 family protein, partial [Clostridia bacterium]
MALQAGMLDSVPETKYLSADNYTQYRAIMRVFYLEHQSMRYQLDKETVLARLQCDPVFAAYTMDQLKQDLNQLSAWKNLTPIQDPHKVYTVADYQNKQFRYMMSQAAVEIERMTITLENLCNKTIGLSASSFRRIQQALNNAGELDQLPLKEVGMWWQDLQEDFKRLNQNHQDYLREFYGPGAEKQMKTAAFIAHKQQLVHYLQEFIRDLQRSAAQIAAQLATFTPEKTAQILERVYQSELEIPRPQAEEGARFEERLRAQERGVWSSLLAWFVGEGSTASQVMEVTNEVIRQVVHNAALLVQMQNMSVSRKAELNRFLELFVQCGEINQAHKLSAQVFGVQQVRHFTMNAPRATDLISSSVYEEPPLVYRLQPRVRTYKPRLEKNGFTDRLQEKESQRAALLESQQRLRELVSSYLENGALNFARL